MIRHVCNGLRWLILLSLIGVSVCALAVAKTRVVFNVQGNFHYRHFLLSKPLRYVVDVYNARHIVQRNKIASHNNTIGVVRVGRYRPHVKRIVFDLKRPAQIKSFILKNGKNHFRLVFDFMPSKVTSIKHHKQQWSLSKPLRLRAAAIVPGQRMVAVPSSVVPIQQAYNAVNSKNPREAIIVIDPGHGGKDPGATGAGGTHEKNVVLAISKDLQRYINKQPGFKAVLTRTGDYFIPLRGRLAIARRYKADMFIAIHADAYRNHKAGGVSVFALSQRGATSEAARWLATRENQSELMGGVELNDKSNILKSVLINLSQTATIRSSLMIGRDMIEHIRGIARLHHRKVEQAAFVVLKSPDIPSLLVETGFLSNPYEERRLRSQFYQRQIALALMRGIKQYFVSSPPRNTWLAYWRDHPRSGVSQYRVVRGDTLTGIADRFRVTVQKIQGLNHLASNDLRVGQQLVIPGNH
ncbi:MAG: N-acetylmuramoyl-L-alanine amidase [Gammaproteobacteria bacterium]|nr:N-acetylmuramoyl-L-alanine amidase [Gammaproteobacteria bacterium]MCH9743899.1 N-acetylmuramoyl-L-alanine amidase [Gammaproteobacteria bacterium]